MNNEKYRQLTTIVRWAWWFCFFLQFKKLGNWHYLPLNLCMFPSLFLIKERIWDPLCLKGIPPLNPKSWIPFKHNGFIGWSKMCIRHAVQIGTSSKNLQIIFSACELSYGLTDYSRCKACVLRGLSSFSFRFSFLSCRIRLLLWLYKGPYHRRGHDLEVG